MANFAFPTSTKPHNQLLLLKKLFFWRNGTAVANKTLEGAMPMTIYKKKEKPMTRKELTEKIIEKKRETGVTWAALAEKIGQSPIWTTAALLGQMQMTETEAKTAADMLGLDDSDAALLATCPYRGSQDQGVPTDALVYRFHEIVQVYGTTLKAVIEEEFGDGIMSAIDFSMDMERVPDPKGDRVKITMNGKFLPYKRY
jgi:cyanate lyase